MKKMCAAVLGVLMLGATCSFAQALPEQKSYYPTSPSREEKPAPYLNDSYIQFMPKKQAARPTQQEKDKFNKAEAKMIMERKAAERQAAEEARRAREKEFEEGLDGNKKLIARYKWVLNKDYGMAKYYPDGATIYKHYNSHLPRKWEDARPQSVLYRSNLPLVIVRYGEEMKSGKKHSLRPLFPYRRVYLVYDMNGNKLFAQSIGAIEEEEGTGTFRSEDVAAKDFWSQRVSKHVPSKKK